MKKIPFDNDFCSFLFSYNTSVHVKKEDFVLALLEFYRVLKYGGLCHVNFLSEECTSYGKGIKVGEGEFVQIEDDEEYTSAYFDYILMKK